jgi:hypothetical protein
VLPETEPKWPFDLQHDIVPIGLVGELPMVISVHPSLRELATRADCVREKEA